MRQIKSRAILQASNEFLKFASILDSEYIPEIINEMYQVLSNTLEEFRSFAKQNSKTKEDAEALLQPFSFIKNLIPQVLNAKIYISTPIKPAKPIKGLVLPNDVMSNNKKIFLGAGTDLHFAFGFAMNLRKKILGKEDNKSGYISSLFYGFENE